MITSQLDTQTYAANAGVRSVPIKTTLDVNCKKIVMELRATIARSATQPNGRFGNERVELSFFWFTTYDATLTPAATDAFISLAKRNVKQRNFILDPQASLSELFQGIDVPMGQTLYTWVETPVFGDGITWVLQLTQHVEGSSGASGGSSSFSNPSPVSVVGGTYADLSGTITLGGTSQTAGAANAARRYLFIQNSSAGDIWVNFGTPAVLNQPSIKIAAGGFYEPLVPSTAQINILGATTAQAFTIKQI